MTKTENKTLVPKLRFAEFEGEWKKSILDEVTNTLTSGSRDWAQFYSPSGSKFIRMTNLSRNGIKLLLSDLKYVDLPKDSCEGDRSSLEAGDILISITAELGKIGLIPQDFGTAYINQHTALVRINKLAADSTFVAHKLSSPQMNKKINRLNDSGAKSGLNLATIRSFPLSIPTLPEQKKIAAFLTAVDDRIEQLKRKKTLLTSYKKGVMSRLFAAGGKNDECGMMNAEWIHRAGIHHSAFHIHHSLRFRNEKGEPYPDWQERKLGDVCKINMGQSPSSSSYNNSKTGLPLIQGNADIKNRKSSPRIWTSEPTKTCQIGDLIITVRAPVGAIAISIHKACMGRGVASITSNKNTSQLFLYQFLLGYESKWGRIEQGSTFTAVSGSDIKGISIKIPSLPEQTKIANFLSSLDTKIEQITQQITQTQTFKKGLLQQMFV